MSDKILSTANRPRGNRNTRAAKLFAGVARDREELYRLREEVAALNQVAEAARESLGTSSQRPNETGEGYKARILDGIERALTTLDSLRKQ